MSDIVIKVEGLSKRYRLGQYVGGAYQYRALRDVLTDAMYAPFRRLQARIKQRAVGSNPTAMSHDPSTHSPINSSTDFIWALKDVSFEVKQGEVVGIIGRNGAGKTTLLKLLSRITEPTKGRAEIKGRIGSLLEVGTGFHPELTGRENIYLSGAILGMTKKEIDYKFDEIVDFSGIEKFIDTPVKRYSSGMWVRLGFAVAAHLEPEILLVDEVLAMGDFQFQKKCLSKMEDTAVSGKTVLFVSHNMSSIRQLCSTCLWIDNGRIRKSGASSSVIDSYLATFEKLGETGECIFDEDPKKEVQLCLVRLLNEEGILTQRFDCDMPVIIELVCQVHRRVPGLYGYLSISRMDRTTVMVSDSFDMVPNPLDDLPVGMYSIRVTIPARTLAPGDYNVYFNLTSLFSFKSFNVDSPGVVCTFHLDDFTSHRGNKRSGYFSTLLSWDVTACHNYRRLLPRTNCVD